MGRQRVGDPGTREVGQVGVIINLDLVIDLVSYLDEGRGVRPIGGFVKSRAGLGGDVDELRAEDRAIARIMDARPDDGSARLSRSRVGGGGGGGIGESAPIAAGPLNGVRRARAADRSADNY